MTNWETVSDEIFLQALRNHCVKTWVAFLMHQKQNPKNIR